MGIFNIAQTSGFKRGQQTTGERPISNAELEQISIKLFGGNIGRIVNLQAALNHSGLLGIDELFSISDVIDAVNYNKGSTANIEEALLNKLADNVNEAEPKLVRSNALTRVQNRVEKAYKWNGKTGRVAPSINWEQATYQREDFSKLGSSLQRTARTLQDTVDILKSYANWIPEHLVKELDKEYPAEAVLEAYEKIREWYDMRSAIWQQFFKKYPQAQEYQQEYLEGRANQLAIRRASNEIQNDMRMEFRKRFQEFSQQHDMDDIVGLWTTMYVQLEAYRNTRYIVSRNMQLDCVMHLVNKAVSDQERAEAAWIIDAIKERKYHASVMFAISNDISFEQVKEMVAKEFSLFKVLPACGVGPMDIIKIQKIRGNPLHEENRLINQRFEPLGMLGGDSNIVVFASREW